MDEIKSQFKTWMRNSAEMKILKPNGNLGNEKVQ
jgi:hypothetical protein